MKKCALVIGHKKQSPGALNKSSGTTEFAFNEQLALDIEERVSGVNVQRIYRRTYRTLPTDINELNPDFIISLHCNAFNESVSGTEVLYYHRSKKGKRIASILNDHLVDALELNDRGVKPKTSEDRGGYLLKHTTAPCLIAEPFFIDNNKDFQVVNDKREGLITAYVNAIQSISKSL
ncbi:hypothetical protein BIT28_21425 [Photobacterium proteolyticum]|uniref:N-acetylmuramoyl-L-alanine amidase n=1 Tax=Photobacterium proteolyticum TaxID=1903952 RepID=A0A1Q9GFY4_9GAMM|nr:N-acetylmuramoyl-L-alanine amidase [Photobacterium proteolyticum]OLQ73296.1 hypothetical protein BIT28_21425 [Photobacterium proteolyticum]